MQGNLDPAALLAPWRELRWRIDDVLERADGRPGHIFNLGHGLVPQTPVDNVRLLVEHVRGADIPDVTTPGVLVMAYGGPDSLDDIPGYLADIRAGRTTPRHVVDEITENYRAIGGRSPLLEVTRKQVDALGEVLGGGYACYLGMRHWSPWIEDVVGEMVEDGITRAVGLVLARTSAPCRWPSTSSGSRRPRPPSRDDRVRARSQLSRRARVDRRVRCASGRRALPLARRRSRRRPRDLHRAQPPRARLANGDPYGAQCLETAQLVAAGAGLADERWSWSYQSAGRTPEPWAGPDLGEHLRELNARGVSGVVVVPVGFVSDHVELLFDVDVKARAVADELGMRLERPPALNDDPVFIEALAELVRGRSRVKVVVVGGGIAGLVAARDSSGSSRKARSSSSSARSDSAESS